MCFQQLGGFATNRLDVRFNFFYPLLQEAVVLRMPPEYRQWKWCAVHSGFCEVYNKCKRAMRGLKQSSRAFSDLVAADFEEQGCVRRFCDPAWFIKWQPKSGIDPEPPPTGSKQKGRLPNARFAKDEPRLKDPYDDSNMPFSTGMSLDTHDLMLDAAYVVDYACTGSSQAMYDDSITHQVPSHRRLP